MFDRGKRRLELEGTIAAAGFGSGDRFVIGLWERGPLGQMCDVMWADPSGRKILLASRDAVASFVGGIYRFDEHRVVPFDVGEGAGDRVVVRAGPLEIDLHAGAPHRLFALRPMWLRHNATWVRVEDLLLRPLAGRLLRGVEGVRTYGASPSGVREWYRIDAYRPVVAGAARLDGRDLGALGPLEPPAGFGFSEFPRRPALVRCSPLLEGAERFLPLP
jgi:hypothetical protein